MIFLAVQWPGSFTPCKDLYRMRGQVSVIQVEMYLEHFHRIPRKREQIGRCNSWSSHESRPNVHSAEYADGRRV